jgi:PTH1 family peptidyl-tRNA hydrolase
MTDAPTAAPTIKLIVGLGNPGRRYAKTRHNVGFMVVDELVHRLGSRGWREERLASVCDVVLGTTALLLLKPQTFMNRSGHAVIAYASRAKSVPESILVVADDLDLPFGRLRLRPGGSAGGHNGLRSIAAELQTETFARLRVGIGRPVEGEPIDYVLAQFNPAESVNLPAIVGAAYEMACAAVESGLLVAMNQFNGRSNARELPAGPGVALAAPPQTPAPVDADHA